MTIRSAREDQNRPQGISLASAWNPRGELQRLEKLLPVLRQAYRGLAITLPPAADPGIARALEAFPSLRVVITGEWSWGRHMSLEAALDFQPAHVHYADFDRLLRWVETRREEWLEIIAKIQCCDCLVIGRTQAAYCTHPRALIETEAISNRVTSYLAGRDMDVSAGSKGFSRIAVQFILANCRPGRALGTDADWLITLRRAGFDLEYVQVDGLDWESADRYQDQAADELSQSQAAQAYDADPEHWAQRVQVALEIVEAGIEADQRDLETRRDTKVVRDESGEKNG